MNQEENWIPVRYLPERTIKVKWLYESGVEDVGIYFSDTKEFATIDQIRTEGITHWKPLQEKI